MATFFRQKIIKDVGTQKIEVFEAAPGTNATIIGLNLANTSEFAIQASILIRDDTSVEAFYVKDVMISPQTAFKAMIGGEKVIIPSGYSILVQSDQDDSIDAIISYVDIT
jgi:hypothetical protein